MKTLLDKVLETCNSILGTEVPVTMSIMDQYAWLHMQQKKYKKAESIFVNLLKIQEQKHDKEDPKTLNAMESLAWFYQNQSQYTKAEEYLKEILSIREKTLGKDHKDTATARQNLKAVKNLQNPK